MQTYCAISLMKLDYFETAYKKVVIKIISEEESNNMYKIYMYYDNVYNQANGEDL